MKFNSIASISPFHWILQPFHDHMCPNPAEISRWTRLGWLKVDSRLCPMPTNHWIALRNLWKTINYFSLLIEQRLKFNLTGSIDRCSSPKISQSYPLFHYKINLLLCFYAIVVRSTRSFSSGKLAWTAKFTPSRAAKLLEASRDCLIIFSILKFKVDSKCSRGFEKRKKHRKWSRMLSARWRRFTRANCCLWKNSIIFTTFILRSSKIQTSMQSQWSSLLDNILREKQRSFDIYSRGELHVTRFIQSTHDLSHIHSTELFFLTRKNLDESWLNLPR